MIIKLLIDGGDMKPGPAIAQQLGPKGINIGKVISKVNDATTEFKGVKVPVELDVNEKTKDFEVKVFSPPTAELIKKALNLEKGTAEHKKIKVGNASIEDIIKIAETKLPNMLEKDLKAGVKSILGTCASIGILVENKEPNELIKEVAAGVFDREINEGLTITSPEKRQKINSYFNDLKKAQDMRLEQEKKAAEEEAAKAGAVPAAAKADEAAKTEAAKAATASKAPEKKEEKKAEAKKK